MGALYPDNCKNALSNYTIKEQKGPTCYANAIAGIICLASERVHGREPLDFIKIRDEIIEDYGLPEGGGNVRYILLKSRLLSSYRLRSKEIDASEAKSILCQSNPRPILATFYLNENQWNAFGNFFSQNKNGILYPKDLKKYYDPKKTDTPGGHAVIIMEMKNDIFMANLPYYKIANSWGKEWGQDGYFKVSVAFLLDINFTFYDVFWYESDLTPEEREQYKRDFPNA